MSMPSSSARRGSWPGWGFKAPSSPGSPSSRRKEAAMTPKRWTLLAASLVLLLSTSSVRAGAAGDADTQVLVDAIRANRKALVAVNLKLTDEEAKKFWPAYDHYQQEMNAVQDRLVKIIEDYTASFR